MIDLRHNTKGQRPKNRMARNRWRNSLTFLLLLPPSSFILINNLHAGWYAAEIFSLGVGSRACAMGGAYTAVADDGFSVWWNSAGAVRNREPWVAVMHSSPTKLREFNFVSAGYTRKRFGFSIGVASLKVDSIQQLPDTIVPEPIGFFSDKEIAALLSIAYRYKKNTEIGLNIKHITYSLFSMHATGWGADIGITTKFANIPIGMVLKDIGGTWITWDTHRKDFRQTNFVLGSAYYRKNLLLSADIGYEYGFLYRIGIEYSLIDVLFLRAGWNKNITLGMGIAIKKIAIDYSYSAHKLDPFHQISASLSL